MRPTKPLLTVVADLQTTSLARPQCCGRSPDRATRGAAGFPTQTASRASPISHWEAEGHQHKHLYYKDLCPQAFQNFPTKKSKKGSAVRPPSLRLAVLSLSPSPVA